jgi:molecular chaperone IbpA
MPNIDKTKPSERGHSAHRKGAKEKTMNNLARLNVADFPKFFLGFDRFETVNPNIDGGYPRYNIVRTESGYRVEIAVPGWNKSNIEISQHKDVLTVKGLCKQTEKDGESYIYKGLSGKEFVRTFTLHKHVQLKKAYMNRGLLCIDLDEVVPDEDRPKMINIE